METPKLSKLSIGDVCKIHKPAYEGITVTVVSLPNAKNGFRTYGVVSDDIMGEQPFRRSELELIQKVEGKA